MREEILQLIAWSREYRWRLSAVAGACPGVRSWCAGVEQVLHCFQASLEECVECRIGCGELDRRLEEQIARLRDLLHRAPDEEALRGAVQALRQGMEQLRGSGADLEAPVRSLLSLASAAFHLARLDRGDLLPRAS